VRVLETRVRRRVRWTPGRYAPILRSSIVSVWLRGIMWFGGAVILTGAASLAAAVCSEERSMISVGWAVIVCGAVMSVAAFTGRRFSSPPSTHASDG
jgi:hypothetical protein